MRSDEMLSIRMLLEGEDDLLCVLLAQHTWNSTTMAQTDSGERRRSVHTLPQSHFSLMASKLLVFTLERRLWQ